MKDLIKHLKIMKYIVLYELMLQPAFLATQFWLIKLNKFIVRLLASHITKSKANFVFKKIKNSPRIMDQQ